MAGPRDRRRRGTSEEDQFIAWILTILNWARNNTRALIMGIVAVGLLAGGVLYYQDYQNRLREAASTEIRALRAEFEAGNDGNVVSRARSFIGQFSGTPYADEAQVLLANALLRQGQAAQAIEPARQAAQELGNDPLGTRASLLLAAAYEEVADTAMAISVYEQVGETARLELERRRGLEGAARLRAARGDYAGAVELYERLLDLAPEGSVQRSRYEMRLAEVRQEAEDRPESGTGTASANGP